MPNLVDHMDDSLLALTKAKMWPVTDQLSLVFSQLQEMPFAAVVDHLLPPPAS